MMRDVFFSRDPLTGRRKPTGVFWAALAGFIIVAAMGGAVAYAQKTRPVFPTPNPTIFPPTATATQTPLPTSTPTATATWTPVPTEDARALQVRGKLESIAQCPRDINEWDWAYMIDAGSPASRVIQAPPCARDNLTRSLAWNYALGIGYERDEITVHLGFDEYPILFPAPGTRTPFRTDKQVWITDVDVYSNAALLSNFRRWVIYEDGTPAKITYLVKCYPATFVHQGWKRTFAEVYDAPFTAQCLTRTIVEGKVVYYLTQFPDGTLMAVRAERPREEGYMMRELFAYIPGNNVWVYQGVINDRKWSKPVDDELAQFLPGYYEAYQEDNAYFDGISLMQAWSLTPVPLPSNWQKAVANPRSFQDYKAYMSRWEMDIESFKEDFSWPYKNP